MLLRRRVVPPRPQIFDVAGGLHPAGQVHVEGLPAEDHVHSPIGERTRALGRLDLPAPAGAAEDHRLAPGRRQAEHVGLGDPDLVRPGRR